MKTLTTMRIETEILKEAKELGINIPKACENTLKLYIQAIKNANNQIFLETLSFQQNKAKEKVGIGTVGSELVRPPGFEPGSSAWQADVLDQARLRPPISFSSKLIFKSFTFKHNRCCE